MNPAVQQYMDISFSNVQPTWAEFVKNYAEIFPDVDLQPLRTLVPGVPDVQSIVSTEWLCEIAAAIGTFPFDYTDEQLKEAENRQLAQHSNSQDTTERKEISPPAETTCVILDKYKNFHGYISVGNEGTYTSYNKYGDVTSYINADDNYKGGVVGSPDDKLLGNIESLGQSLSEREKEEERERTHNTTHQQESYIID